MLNLLFLLTTFSLFSPYLDTQSDTIPCHPFGEYREEICDKISIASQAVVIYESSSLLYLKLESKEAIEVYDVSIAVNEKVFKEVNITSNRELIAAHLPLNSTIDVTYTDGCGQRSSLIYTTMSPPLSNKGLTVSKGVMDAVKRLYASGKSDVVKFLENDPTLHYYEKLSFLQNTILDGKAIPDKQQFGVYPDKSLIAYKESECSCVLLVMQSDFAPGYPVLQSPSLLPIGMEGTPTNTGYISSDDDVISADWSNNDNEGGYTHNVYSKGAARQQDTWANGRRIHTQLASKMVGSDEISPNYAYVGISWFCFRDGHVEESCDCRKRVNYSAVYNTRLRTSMSLPNCFLCGSKSGKSKAEDWAILALTNEADFVQILEAGKATVETEMSKTYNPEFLIEYIEVLAALAPVLVASDSNMGNVFIEQVDNIVEQVTDLIQTPLTLINSSSNKDASIALINKEGSFQITPNEVWYLKMFSFGNTDVEGATSWNGAARIASSFRLGVAIRAGVDSGLAESCCTLGGSCWICSSFPDAPVSASTYMNNLNTFFYLHNTGFTFNEYGTFWKKGGCLPGWGKLEENSSFLNSESKYYMYDLLGRLHATGELSPENLDSFIKHEIINKQLSSGIYLLSVVSKEGKQYSQKIFIH